MNLDWTRENSKAAQAQGWDLWNVDNDHLEIQRLDEAAVFESDEEALAFVTEQVRKGDPLAGTALALNGQSVRNSSVMAEFLVVREDTYPNTYALYKVDQTKVEKVASDPYWSRLPYDQHPPSATFLGETKFHLFSGTQDPDGGMSDFIQSFSTLDEAVLRAVSIPGDCWAEIAAIKNGNLQRLLVGNPYFNESLGKYELQWNVAV